MFGGCERRGTAALCRTSKRAGCRLELPLAPFLCHAQSTAEQDPVARAAGPASTGGLDGTTDNGGPGSGREGRDAVMETCQQKPPGALSPPAGLRVPRPRDSHRHLSSWDVRPACNQPPVPARRLSRRPSSIARPEDCSPAVSDPRPRMLSSELEAPTRREGHHLAPASQIDAVGHQSAMSSRLVPKARTSGASGSGRTLMKRTLIAATTLALAGTLTSCGGDDEPTVRPRPSHRRQAQRHPLRPATPVDRQLTGSRTSPRQNWPRARRLWPAGRSGGSSRPRSIGRVCSRQGPRRR
jgi:hypothetical protein